MNTEQEWSLWKSVVLLEKCMQSIWIKYFIGIGKGMRSQGLHTVCQLLLCSYFWEIGKVFIEHGAIT